jgi:hypothetical protein
MATPACCRSPSPSLKGGLLISTLTWWALYSIVIEMYVSNFPF